MMNVQLNELMSNMIQQGSSPLHGRMHPIKAAGVSYQLLQHREGKETTCGSKSRMRLLQLFSTGQEAEPQKPLLISWPD